MGIYYPRRSSPNSKKLCRPRFHFALSRFGDRVTKTTVIVSESANAEQNAGSCSISVDLKPFGQLVAQETDPEVYAAIDRAAAASGGYPRYSEKK
jgi:hypothetical protein